ncbi:unnamed protein product [Pneumocystis jirovecii]|uniref:Uncharacterized protein n=2 Tax=Pneumocystis jirovecii TaxID=42068 RepID=L0PBH5_PNEJI|nr:uncharacterized protein T551_02428 [Pneumocystis jirovecii RU7]KTW29154.1 hypothetical protein T551_02428 [Pneumocystis jirovecii RU7]CCJ28970.1 unnamed protein product [Pneumocystis jirovecii]
MSLPPVPPRPDSPQKLTTCALHSEQLPKKAKDIPYNNLKDEESSDLCQKKLSDELFNSSNKHILTEQMNHLEKDSVINTSYNTHKDINVRFPSSISELNSQEEPAFEKSSSILISTNSIFNTQKQYAYICDENYRKYNKKLYSKPENETYTSFSNNNNNYQLNSLEKNTIITNKETKKHNEEKSLCFSNSFFPSNDTYSPKNFNKNSTITCLPKNIKDSNHVQETKLLSKAIICESEKREPHCNKNNSNIFQKYQKTKKNLEFQEFKTLKTSAQNTLILNNTSLDNKKHFPDNRTCEQNNISLEDTTRKENSIVLSNSINNDTFEIEKHLEFTQKIKPSDQIIKSENKDYQSTNLNMNDKPILPSRPTKKEITSTTLHSSHTSLASIKNPINTRTQFSRNLEEKLKFGPPKILNFKHLQSNTSENDISNSLFENTKPLLELSMLEDLRKTRSKGPSRRKPTIITTKFPKKLGFSNVIKLFDIINDETSENHKKNIIEPIIKNNLNTSNIEDFIENDKPVIITSSNDLSNTFSTITLN